MQKKTRNTIKKGCQFGHWSVKSDAERIGADLRYLCVCVCGTEKTVSAITLRNGSSTHCGCLGKTKRVSKKYDLEQTPTPPEIQEVFHLISQGYLPPADQFSPVDGAPSWTLPTIASILGISLEELISYLVQTRKYRQVDSSPEIRTA